MKNLGLVLGCVVGLVLTSSANTVTWAFSETVSSAYYSTAQSLANYTTYLFAASTWESADKSSLSAMSGSALASATWATKTDTGTAMQFKTGTQTTTTTLALASSTDFYIVIAGASGYAALSASGSVWDETASPAPSYYTVSKALSGATALTSSSFTSYSAVPEPASVGLLMLGLCALGLKRKVA